jgi:hypothetical protein
MKRRILTAALALTLAASGAVLATAPAHASDQPGAICNLNQNTWLRQWPGGPPLRTLTAGRGFRYHYTGHFDGYQLWIYGHGAEAPSQDGWILAANVYGCPI